MVSLVVSSHPVTLFLPKTRAERFAKKGLLLNLGNHSLWGLVEVGKDSNFQCGGVFPEDGHFQFLESEIAAFKTAKTERKILSQGYKGTK